MNLVAKWTNVLLFVILARANPARKLGWGGVGPLEATALISNCRRVRKVNGTKFLGQIVWSVRNMLPPVSQVPQKLRCFAIHLLRAEIGDREAPS